MGSLISKPKAPAAPAPIIMTSPAPTPIAEPALEKKTAAPDAETAKSATDQDNVAQETSQDTNINSRTSDLLRRKRGKGGTILTSFRGVLNNSLKNTPRKTLLGE